MIDKTLKEVNTKLLDMEQEDRKMGMSSSNLSDITLKSSAPKVNIRPKHIGTGLARGRFSGACVLPGLEEPYTPPSRSAASTSSSSPSMGDNIRVGGAVKPPLEPVVLISRERPFKPGNSGNNSFRKKQSPQPSRSRDTNFHNELMDRNGQIGRRSYNSALPGMGMQGVDPDYLGLLSRNVAKNDPDNESWE